LHLAIKPVRKRNRHFRQRPAMARHNHPMQLLLMIGTIGGTAGATIGITPVLHSNSSKSGSIEKGGAGRLPLFANYCVVSEAR
jgi:hypothetical protein